MPLRAPSFKSRPWRRFLQTGTNRGLGVGVATANGGIRYEVVPVFGQSVLSVRIKTAGNGGTIDIVFVGPDFDPDQADTAFASLVGTKYTTGNPAQVAVAAGTEAIIQAICLGDGYAIVKFTGTVGAGTISYVDISMADAAVLAGSSSSSSAGVIAAGENHIGSVGGDTSVTKIPITVNTAVYVAGNNVGGLIDLGAILRVAAGTGIAVTIAVVEAGTQKAPLDFLLFDAAPGDTFTDHAAFPTLALASVLKILARGSVAASDYVTVGGVSTAVCALSGQGLKAASGQHLWLAINTSGTPDFVAATDLNLVLTISRD